MPNPFQYYQPLDPECPGARRIEEMMDDPITDESGCADEIYEHLAKKHRAVCGRCREFGVANIEVR